MDGPLVYTDPSGFKTGSDDCPASGTSNGVKCNPAGSGDSGNNNVTLPPIVNIGSFGSAAAVDGAPAGMSSGSESTINLGKIDVTAKATNNTNTNNTINLGKVDVNAKPAAPNPQPPEVVYIPLIPSTVPEQINNEQIHRLLVEEGVCSNGMMSSRGNNPNEQGNIKTGFLVGTTAGAIVGGVSVAILVAAAPITDGQSMWLILADNPLVAGAEGGFVGATYGASMGVGAGIVLTSPMSSPCL